MAIRKYEPKDYEQIINICLDTYDKEEQEAPINQYIKQMFCRYYIEKEPENCFVVTDDNDLAQGYVYGASDYDTYHKNMTEYLELIAEIRGGMYISDAHIEMYDHEIYKSEFPAHLHIDIFGEFRSKGYGSQMIEAFCQNLKDKGIKGVMLIVGDENTGAQRFYERNGFKLLHKKKTGYAYGRYLTEER